jgi:hypothetical protein
VKIEPMSQAWAGEKFRFAVSGGSGTTRIQVFIGNATLLDTPCNDPPCYEMVMIPIKARGAEVLIVATDSAGNVEQLSLHVSDSSSNQGGTMSRSG